MLEKPVEKLTSFEKWSLFLKFAQEPVHREKINDIIKDREEIGMAAALLQEISQDERERARARSRKMYEMDMYSNYHTAIENGEIRANLRTARNALGEGISVDVIQRITNLPLEEILKLQQTSQMNEELKTEE